MAKNITRTVTTTVVTVEIFLRDERRQTTEIFNYSGKVGEDFINKDLYKKYENGANEMPLFIHRIEYVEKKYSMSIDKFIENATLVDLSE